MSKIREVTLPTALFIVAASVGAALASPKDGVASHESLAPTAVSQDCATKTISVTSSDVLGNGTSSSTYVNLPDGAVTFNQGHSGCIVVDFTAWSFAPTNPNSNLVFVQALLDSVAMFPGEHQFSGPDTITAQSHAASWTASAAAGTHTVQIQFRSGVNGQSVFIHKHTTEVAHK